MIRRPLLIVLLASGLATRSSAGQPKELVGFLTQIFGAVQLSGPGVKGDPLASPWQVVRAGVTLHVPADGKAGIVCSNSHFVRLPGPSVWSLTEEACDAGRELTPAEYALVAPEAGRFKVIAGFMVLEKEIRRSDGNDPLAPVALSPRNAIRSPRPTISWVRVPSAVEYRVELTGRRVRYDAALPAEEVPCVPSFEGFEICSLAWPAERYDLPPDEKFRLGLAAREGVTRTWHSADLVEVRTPALADAESMEVRLKLLESFGLEGGALEAARAGLLARDGLYADAAESYRKALAVAPGPELGVSLGDAYLKSGLHGLAEALYRKFLSNASPAVQAASTFGLGRVEYALGRHKQAAALFQKARELYSKLKLDEEERAARLAADKAGTGPPN